MLKAFSKPFSCVAECGRLTSGTAKRKFWEFWKSLLTRISAFRSAPPKGLDLLKVLDEDGRIAGHYRVDAVSAHLLDMVGDHDAAITHYRDAAARTTSSRNGIT
jgi:hypothetical protein